MLFCPCRPKTPRCADIAHPSPVSAPWGLCYHRSGIPQPSSGFVLCTSCRCALRSSASFLGVFSFHILCFFRARNGVTPYPLTGGKSKPRSLFCFGVSVRRRVAPSFHTYADNSQMIRKCETKILFSLSSSDLLSLRRRKSLFLSYQLKTRQIKTGKLFSLSGQ